MYKIDWLAILARYSIYSKHGHVISHRFRNCGRTYFYRPSNTTIIESCCHGQYSMSKHPYQLNIICSLSTYSVVQAWLNSTLVWSNYDTYSLYIYFLSRRKSAFRLRHCTVYCRCVWIETFWLTFLGSWLLLPYYART